MIDMPTAKPLSLSELNALIPRLQATVTLLTGRANGATRGGATQRADRRKNNADDAKLLRVRIASYLSGQKQGAAAGAIATGVKADVEAVRYNLGKMRAENMVRMTGARSTALWHLR
jgi:hypothetical protein